MDEREKVLANAYKHYLLGFLYMTLRTSEVTSKVELIRDIDSNPGLLEVELPDGVRLQVLVRLIPEEQRVVTQ